MNNTMYKLQIYPYIPTPLKQSHVITHEIDIVHVNNNRFDEVEDACSDLRRHLMYFHDSGQPQP